MLQRVHLSRKKKHVFFKKKTKKTLAFENQLRDSRANIEIVSVMEWSVGQWELNKTQTVLTP